MSAELVPTRGPRGHMDDLIEWAAAAREVHTVAQMIGGTEFVPSALRGRPDAIAAAILTGREVGLSQMMSLFALDVIEGRPALNALALRALVQSKGHDFEQVEASDTRVVVRARRKGSSHWEQSTWTMRRAETAGLAGRKNWRTMPQAMLTARATSEVCRLVAADAIVGLAYSQEELRDGADDVTPEQEPAPTKAKRVVQRAPIPPPPELEPPQQPALPASPETQEPEQNMEQASRVESTEPQRLGALIPPKWRDMRDVAPPPLPPGVVPVPGSADDPDATKPAVPDQLVALRNVFAELPSIEDKLKWVRTITGNYTIKDPFKMDREETKRCVDTANKMIAQEKAKENPDAPPVPADDPMFQGSPADPLAGQIATQEQRNVLHHAITLLKIADKAQFIRQTTGNWGLKNTASMTRQEAWTCIQEAYRLIREREADGGAA